MSKQQSRLRILIVNAIAAILAILSIWLDDQLRKAIWAHSISFAY